jgi:peptidoglycan/xylan/chitin deacetylase (PgdA/CDA1 family)
MIARDLIKNVSAILPFNLSVWAAKPHTVAVFYHTICKQTSAHIKHLYPIVTPVQFEKDLDFLLKYFEPIDLKDYIAHPTPSMGSKPRLLLSFDDGFREIKTIASPILLAKGIPATAFVNPDFVGNNDMLYRCKASLIVDKAMLQGKTIATPPAARQVFPTERVSTSKFCRWIMALGFGQQDLISELAANFDVDIGCYLREQKPYLNLDEVIELSNKGFTVGAHSLNHPNFANLSLTEQIRQVKDSLSWVTSFVPNQPKAFAFPFTNYGLSADFYRYFFSENPEICDVFFGTSGYKPTSTHRFTHRTSLEVKGRSAKQILKGEFYYYLAKMIFNRHKVNIPL